MHLDLFIRGKVEFVSLWEAHVQAQYFKLRRTEIKTGKQNEVAVQMGLRRGVLGSYELVFPKEALPDVLAMLGVVQTIPDAYKYNFNSLRVDVIRKIFGRKKIPKDIYEKAKSLIGKQNIIISGRERCLANTIIPGIAIQVIGIKEDAFGTIDGIYRHELL